VTSWSVTVVIPVYNEERRIAATLAGLAAAALRAPSLEVEVLVVDDGSTDGSAAAAAAAEVSIPVRVIRQANAGRFAARARGLEESAGELVMFLDSRISLDPRALEFIAQRLEADPQDAVWNGHVVIETRGNAYGHFWNVLTELAFAEYFADPRRTSFDAETFDRFPKGTTCFVAPRELVVRAFASHESCYGDTRNANDDTPMIRRIAAEHPIGISPEFACLYQPREALRPFLRHAFHRGIVFLDGHGRRGSRYLPAILVFYPASAAFALGSARRPVLALAGLVGVSFAAGTVAAKRRRSTTEIAAFASLAPVYAVAHGLGMWRGLTLAAAARWRRRKRRN
jgi:hypothetical protein